MKSETSHIDRYTIEDKIMARVYAWYIFRVWSIPVALLATGVGAVATLFSLVSWSHVFANMPSPTHIAAFSDFITGAVFNTELPVKLALALMLALTIVSIRKIAKSAVQGPALGYARNIRY